jgi:hypothetical protein
MQLHCKRPTGRISWIRFSDMRVIVEIIAAGTASLPRAPAESEGFARHLIK